MKYIKIKQAGKFLKFQERVAGGQMTEAYKIKQEQGLATPCCHD